MVKLALLRTNQNLRRQIGACIYLSLSSTSISWSLEEVSAFVMKLHMQWTQDSHFPYGTSGKESVCQCKRHLRHRFSPWVEKIPWRKEMATHSSILAWKIQLTEEPGGLLSMGSQRVRQDWADRQAGLEETGGGYPAGRTVGLASSPWASTVGTTGINCHSAWCFVATFRVLTSLVSYKSCANFSRNPFLTRSHTGWEFGEM